MGTKSIASERDLRFDFFRGLALLFICINHIEGGVRLKTLAVVTIHTAGLYDHGMTFVFISGMMYGYINEKIYLNHGLPMMWARSVIRAVQVYFFQILLLTVVLGIAGVYLHHSNDWELMNYVHLEPYLKGDFIYFSRFLLFDHFPLFFDILPLYILLLMVMPLCLYGINKRPYLTTFIAFVIYVISAFIAYFGPGRYLPLYNGAFILTIWQMLFLIGMILGVKKRSGTLRISYEKRYLYPAIAWVAFTFVNEKLLFEINDFVVKINPLFLHHIPYTARRYLPPHRLLSFFILIYVVSYFVRGDSKLFKNAIGRAIISCGQQSLEVFTFGVFLAYSGTFFVKGFGGGRPLLVITEIFMLLLTVAFAYYLKWRKREPWRQVPSMV